MLGGVGLVYEGAGLFHTKTCDTNLVLFLALIAKMFRFESDWMISWVLADFSQRLQARVGVLDPFQLHYYFFYI